MRRILGGIWLGSAAFILITAPAIFAAAGTPANAANVVGAMLTRWHYISLIAPALLLLMDWRRGRGWILAALFAGILLAAGEVMVDVRIRQMRNDSVVPISSLARTNVVRRRFGLLHGASALLLVGQALAAAAFLAMDRD